MFTLLLITTICTVTVAQKTQPDASIRYYNRHLKQELEENFSPRSCKLLIDHYYF